MRPRALRLVTLVCGLSILAGCVADPPPVADLRQQGDGDTTEPVEEGADGITVAVESLTSGFNPHLIGQQHTSTDLVSSLVWPSAFVEGADGELVLNTDLLDSAEVVRTEPFTVRYEIAQAAQWSDSSPIAVEDFDYLWRQMTTRPGVVDPGGYERIRDVRSGPGGKVVDVEFSEPYEHWRTLFTHILPAHLLRNIDDGFLTGLDSGPQVSGGPYMIGSIDLGRGEIEFVPNDRYWATAPDASQIVVRRSIGTGAVGQALRSTDSVVGLLSDTGVNRTVADNISGLDSTSLSSTTQIELGFNVASASGGDEATREAAAAALDTGDIARIVSESPEPSVSRFPFAGTGPADGAGRGDGAGPDGGVAAELLAEAGYEHRGGRWWRDGEPLHFTIGVDPIDSEAVLAAGTAADQLRSAGISAQVWEIDSAPMFADALPNGLVDAVVTRSRLDGDPVPAAESRFGCAAPVRPEGTEATTTPGTSDSGATSSPTRQQRLMTTESDLQPPRRDDASPTPTATADGGAGESDTTDDPTATPTPTTPERHGDPTTPARGANVTGFCDPRFDAFVERAAEADDTAARDAALEDAAGVLESAGVRVPLVAPGRLVAAGSDIGGLPAPGSLDTEADLLTTIASWERIS